MSVLDEWIEKAEAGYKGAVDLKRRRKDPLPDLVCYHCQQTVEKYLKAYLIAQSATPPPIHNLVTLLNLCLPHAPSLATLAADANLLNPYSVDIRYPGNSATLADAQDAMKAARCCRTALRKQLGL